MNTTKASFIVQINFKITNSAIKNLNYSLRWKIHITGKNQENTTNKSKTMPGHVEKTLTDWISSGRTVNYFDTWPLVIAEYFPCSPAVLLNKQVHITVGPCLTMLSLETGTDSDLLI